MFYLHSLSSSSPIHTPKEEYIIGQAEEQGEIVGNHTEQPQSLNGQIKICKVRKKNVYFSTSLPSTIPFALVLADAAKLSSSEPTPGPEITGTGDGSSWEEQLYVQQEQLEKEMQETRKMVTRLQVSLFFFYTYTYNIHYMTKT